VAADGWRQDMRWWVFGLLIAMVCPALAADYDDSWLRGSQVLGAAPTPPPRLYRIWAGVYGGAQVGEDFHGADFRSIPTTPVQSAIGQDAILAILSAPTAGLPNMPQVNSNGPSYGGFIGYNWQIDDVVFGAEFNANRSNFHQTAINYATRGYWVNNSGYLYDTSIYVNSQGTVDMSDYFTFRGRLGWAFGNFLPYLVAGVAVAQVDTGSKVDVGYSGVCQPTTVPPATPNCPITGYTPITHLPIYQMIGGNYPFTNISHGKYQLGFDAALGMDYMISQSIFVRGEVEYLNFQYPSEIKLSTVSVRTAIGLRF
jgi:outer membrane immunogenic protein